MKRHPKPVAVAELTPHPRNYKQHPEEQLDHLVRSLEENGQYRNVVIAEDDTILAGHGVVMAAQRMGLGKVLAVRMPWAPDDPRALKLLALDNEVARLAPHDDNALADLLREVQAAEIGLLGTGFDDRALDALIAACAPAKDPHVGPTLTDRFLVPPFSVLDARQGYWRKRKRQWIEVGIRSELGRGEKLLGLSGGIVEQTGAPNTSVFDPVLCEIAYRWFCPPGGRIVDPFAGGSVRGVVAGMLGRAYHGIDLRAEQVEANRAQWEGIAPSAGAPPSALANVDGRYIVRHDRTPGGTKEVALKRLLAGPWADHQVLVYASPAYGFAQVALARAAAEAGKRAVVFVARRRLRHQATAMAAMSGAEVHEVSPGYLSNVQAKARAWAEESGAFLVPFGVDCEEMVAAIAEVAREIAADMEPPEVWCVAGSGVLTRALQRAWPDAKHYAIAVGKEPEAGGAEVIRHRLKFEERSAASCPFPSNAHYDRKGWEMFAEDACSGALFWNVAGDPVLHQRVAPKWSAGDAADVLRELTNDSADFVFTCPPYGDLEVYSDDPRDLSTLDDAGFLAAYRDIIDHAVRVLRPGRFCAIVVGDYRRKDGTYSNFVGRTVQAFEDAGARLYNEAVLVSPVGSMAMRATRQFSASRKLVRGHQQLLVFVKGSWKAARAACGELGELDFGELPTEPEDGTVMS